MPSHVGKKCGEIIITMKKNAKNVYSFNCWFCDTIYLQMKKFTLHLENEHESQLVDTESAMHEENKPLIDVSVESSYVPEIKVENCQDIKSEDEEEHEVARNSNKTENSTSYHDPLAQTTLEEIQLPLHQEEQEIFAISDPKNETFEDTEMMGIFSDDNDHVNEHSDFSAEENSSSSSDDDEDERLFKPVKDKICLLEDKTTIEMLINRFKSIPQLWDTSQPEKCGLKQKEKLWQTLTDNLNLEFKLNLKLCNVRKKMNSLCKEYEKWLEMETDDKKDSSELTTKSYFEHMEFLKATLENKLKHKKKKSNIKVKPLSDKLLSDLIDIYKNYTCLWNVNHLAYTIKEKRHETMEIMLEEIKTKMNLTLDIYMLEKHLAHIHKCFAKEKKHELACEKQQQDFLPNCQYYNKCDFLTIHQGPFCCDICNEIVETYNDFQIHKSTHDGSAPFKCQECGMGFKKISNYTIHAKRHLRVFKFICKICGKGYPFNAELDLHMRSHTGAQPYLCSVCGEGFRTAISYDNHIRRHEERFKYFCHICKKGFNHMTRLNDHVKAHLNVRDVICAVCGKGFTSRKYLNHHKRIHEGKNYICNICGKSFAQDAGLRAHKKYHGTPIGSVQKEQKNKYNLT